MRIQTSIYLLALVVGCGGETKPMVGSKSDSGQDVKGDCDVTISSTYPEAGATDHYYLDPIRFVLSEPDSSAKVVTDVSGTTTTDAGGRTIVFTPDEPLEPSTSYTVGLDYCYANADISFSTSSYGMPIDPDVELEGRVFSLDLTSGDYTEGENAGELLNALFTRHVLFELQDIEGNEVSALTAVSKKSDDPIEQDLCARTVPVSGIDMSAAPYFAVDFSELVFGAHDGELRFTNFAVDGSISSDGSRIGGIAFSATMAVDEMSRVLPDVGGVEALCAMAENLGIPCRTCPSDDFALCITVAAEHMLASTEDISLEEVSEAGQAEGCE